jgi:hypothetical protein
MRAFVEEQTLLREDPARVARYFNEARAVAAEQGVELRLPTPRLRRHAPGTPGRERCEWPWRGAYVSYEGLAMPCCMVATPDRANFGSVRDGLLPIWNGEDYRAFRARLASAVPPDVCRTCAVYNHTF